MANTLSEVFILFIGMIVIAVGVPFIIVFILIPGLFFSLIEALITRKYWFTIFSNGMGRIFGLINITKTFQNMNPTI